VEAKIMEAPIPADPTPMTADEGRAIRIVACDTG
jgi:hypothetical protein